MKLAGYVNKGSQRRLAAAVTRILVGAMVVTALGLGCTDSARAHNFPIAPIFALKAQKQKTSASTLPAVRAESAETHAEFDDEEMCGYSILDYQSASASNSTDAIGNQQLESENVQGGGSLVGGLPGMDLAALNLRSAAAPAPVQAADRRSFRWDGAIKQSMLFLAISHAFRFATEPRTRADIKGPFWRDYFQSVGNLRGWGDGDEFRINYIGHPLEGAVAGFIQIHNDPKGIRQEVGFNKGYWKSRLKAFGWASAFSTQYEIGLLSEASLGNVGLGPNDKSNHPMGYVDLIVTPVLGTAWLVGEDLIDRYVIRRFEDKVRNRVARAIVRSFLNPGRSFAHMLRGKLFWDRDDRPLRAGS